MNKLSKLITAITLAVTMAFASAADNSIYVDQMGDNSTVNMIQDGAGNIIRGLAGVGTSNSTPAKIYGDGTQVAVSQIGASNTLRLAMVSTIATGAGGGTSITYSVTGNNASATINSNGDGLGISASNNIAVTQSGNNSSANINVLGSLNNLNAITAGGSNNSITATQNGDNNNTTISNTGGGGNSTTTNQQGNNGMISIASVGASNTTTVSQTGGSTNGHQATVDITGSSNTTSITQNGTSGDSVVNLKSVGSTNTFTINSNTH